PRQVLAHTACSRHSVVDHEFAVSASLGLRRRHAFDGGTVFCQLTLQLDRIGPIATATRQVQRCRIDLQGLPTSHAGMLSYSAASRYRAESDELVWVLAET